MSIPHSRLTDPTPRASSGLALLRSSALNRLTGVLDEVVGADASLATARSLLLNPLRLLEAMAQEAEGALGDDVIAAERLRLLVTLAESDTSPAMMPGMLGRGDADGSAPIAAQPPGPPCTPALIDMGALVIVGLAAGRVGDPLGLADPMIGNVLSLALAAGPAETLTRAIAAGMSNTQVAAVLTGIASHAGGSRTVSATVAAFLADPCERARWVCLDAVFDQIRGDVGKTTWDAAASGFITSLDPADACAGETLSIHLDLSPPPGASKESDASHFLPRLADGRAVVVFASPGRAAIGATGTVDPAGIVHATVPDEATPGWVGFADLEALKATNEARAALREAWTARNAQSSCLKATPVPVSAIPSLPDPPSPPRSPAARFTGGIPLIANATLAPSVVRIGEPVSLSWDVEGATSVQIDPGPGRVEASGEVRFNAPADQAEIERIIVASNRCGQAVEERVSTHVRARITELRLSQDDIESPLIAGHPIDLSARIEPADTVGRAIIAAGTWVREVRISDGRIDVRIPIGSVADGLTGTLRVFSSDYRADDERAFGPLIIVEPRLRTLVLLRPAIVGRALRRVPPPLAATTFNTLQRSQGLALDLIEPALLEDDDVTCASPPNGPDVPETLRLLERLNVLAARNPGMEDALWLAVVPTPAHAEGFYRIEPGEASRAVAVSTLDVAGKLLLETLPPLEPSAQRLRVIAELGADGTIRLERMRLEERRAGPGAPLITDLTTLAYSGGEVRARQALRAMSNNRPAHLVALLAVTDDVDALELHSARSEERSLARAEFDGEVTPAFLRRVQRPAGEPRLRGVELDDETIAWQYRHTRSARASFTVEVGRRGLWSPIAVGGGCDESAVLPLERVAPLAHADRVRVVASDGWNTAISPASGVRLPEMPQFRALARFAGNRRFWADLDFETSEGPDDIVWSFDDEERTGPVVTLPRRFAGTLTLTVRGPEGELTDTRTIAPDGTVDDRSIRVPREGVRV